MSSIDHLKNWHDITGGKSRPTPGCRRVSWLRFAYRVPGALLALVLVTAGPIHAQTISSPEELWLDEEEFLADDSLHAFPGQTVVLELESTRSENQGNGKGEGKRIIRNALRFEVAEADNFQFCIPEDEPHLQRLKLKRNRGRTLLNGRAGSKCESIRLEPGRYTLDIYHDGRSVPLEGATAFFHQPGKVQLTGGLGAVNGAPDFIAFRAPNNKFVSGPPNAITLQATATSVGPREVWRLAQKQLQNEPGTFYTLNNGNGFLVNNQAPDCSGDSTIYVVPQTQNCSSLPSPFLLNDHGGGTFNLVLTSVSVQGDLYSGGVFTRTDGTENLFYNTSKRFSGESMSWEYKGYDCSTDCNDETLPLSQGEIALYAECNFKGPAMVFAVDAAALSLFDAAADVGLGIGNNSLSSIRVGPNTLAILYEEAQFGGSSVKIGVDVPCLSSTEFGENATSSLQIEGLFTYIASANGCTDCVLNGIDFSDEDFSGGLDFTNSIFDEAILTNASFNGANLTQAHFSGAKLSGVDFSNANLSCTQLDGSDVTSSTFANNVLRTDFACYLNFTDTALNYSTIAQANWRYLNLSWSRMNNVPDTLSTAVEPLDLSGSRLSNVKWLAGKAMDYANFGCYASELGQDNICPEPNGATVCSTLQGTALSSASLRRTCFRDASMEGAFLSFANLDSADMSGVQLQALSGGKVATLEGAFMRNVDLSGANLTGVTANNVSFYTASGGTADATGITAPGANFSESYLAFADFSGAQSVLQSTTWINAMLIGADFSQADLSTNTSGGVNSGTNTTFEGAYLQGAQFDTTTLDDVNFINTYWDAIGAGGELNFLLPKQNLLFQSYWKDAGVPECPPALTWHSGLTPPMMETSDSNTCPNGLPGPCDSVWDSPIADISLAYFKSTVPPDYPQDATVSAELQCGTSFNPVDFCWLFTAEPPLPQCLAVQ